MNIEDKYLSYEKLDDEMSESERQLYDDIEDAINDNDMEIDKLKQYQMMKFQRKLEQIIHSFKNKNKGLLDVNDVLKGVNYSFVNGSDGEYDKLYYKIFKVTIK